MQMFVLTDSVPYVDCLDKTTSLVLEFAKTCDNFISILHNNLCDPYHIQTNAIQVLCFKLIY